MEEPPKNVPRIVDVQNPASGHHVVMVRMPTLLASKWPDKPWGTPIDTIGLSKQDADRFANYTLVDVERLSDSSDLLWIFQKLDGPVWTTKGSDVGDLTPAKFRRQVITTKTEQEVTPGTAPDAAGTVLDQATGERVVNSKVEDQPNTGKAVKTTVSEAIDTNADPLVGELTDTWGVNTAEEQLVGEGDPAVFGYGVKSSRVAPLGNGMSVLETERYPVDEENDGIIYTLSGREVDEATEAVIQVDKSLVDASRAFALVAAIDAVNNASPPPSIRTYAEIQPIDKWHSIMVASKVTYAPQGRTWKETGDISLPDVLLEVGVIWDSDVQLSPGSAGVDNEAAVIANEYRWQADAEVSAVASVFGRPYTKVASGFRGMAEVTVVRTFHTSPPTEGITAHLFKPVNGTLTIHGVQGMVASKASASGIGAIQISNSLSGRKHFDTKMAIAQIGPFEHSLTSESLQDKGDLKTIGGPAVGGNPNGYVAASGGNTPGPEPYPVAEALIELEGNASLELPPSSTPLAPGSSFIRSVQVNPWRFGYWVKEVYTAKVPGTLPPP